jgi:F0F1-type ATP synthase alpha subunit
MTALPIVETQKKVTYLLISQQMLFSTDGQIFSYLGIFLTQEFAQRLT